VVDICAKLFQNPSMHDKVAVWTWLLCKWVCTDSQTDMSLGSLDTSVCFYKLCLWYMPVWPSLLR
jgi:hypothetical protein